MLQHRTPPGRTGLIIRAVLLGLLFIFIFGVTLLTVLFLLGGHNFDFGQATSFRSPSPQPNPTPTIAPRPLVTPIAAALTTFRSVALGFSIDYPADWRKKEKTLQVILSPSPAGLEPEHPQDAAIWVGIPANEDVEPVALLQDALADFPANVQILNTGTLNIDSQAWTSIQISFADPDLGGTGMATLAATQHNDVGYLIGAVAPAQRWSSLQPLFQGVINSFRFTEEIVIRPTDATPPPTPTPTPTPRIYIVQPGDTLSGIAVQFGVSMESLVNRNAIERPEYLRSGQKLIIPTQKR